MENWGENGPWVFSTEVHQISSLQIREKTREKTEKELWMTISSITYCYNTYLFSFFLFSLIDYTFFFLLSVFRYSPISSPLSFYGIAFSHWIWMHFVYLFFNGGNALFIPIFCPNSHFGLYILFLLHLVPI